MTAQQQSVGCPAHISPDRVREFDYTRDPIAAVTPFEGYLQYRGEPHFWSPVAGGFWVLTDAAAIRDCFQDAETFSNRNIGLGYTAYETPMIPEQLDPPEHGKYRRLLSPFFTPASARRLEDDVRAICRQQIDAFIDDGECDFVEQFAGRYPQIVFLRHVLNLPLDQMETFLAWEHDMMRHPRDNAAAKTSSDALLAYLAETIAERAAHPLDDDLLSQLLQLDVDGRTVTQEETLNIAFLLFLAGLDTVTSALSLSFHFLAQSAAHRQQIVADPAIVPMAIEELLRYTSFVSSVRTATRDLEFHGIELKEGDRLLPVSVLAARDSNEFDQPDEVVFERSIKRHMAFGAGIHRCLGSHLARVEMKIAYEEWHRRIPEYHLAPDAEVVFHAAGTLGMGSLPLVWDAAKTSAEAGA